MRYCALRGIAASVSQDRPTRRKILGGAAIVLLMFAGVATAQGTVPDGDYSAVFKGKVHYTDRQPAEQQVVEQATIRISTSGDNVTIDVGQLGSAMSATQFQGTSGNSKFVAMQSSPGKENQAKLLWGEVLSSNTLRGTLLYPRVADGLVPGYTELIFEAKPLGASGSTASTPTPRDRMPTNSSSSDLRNRFPQPSANTSSSNTKPEKELKPRQPTIPTGSSVIRGRFTGDTSRVENVQLSDMNEKTLQTETLDRNGNYRFNNVAEGRYYIYVEYGKGGAYITADSGDAYVNADGRSSYRVDFTVQER